MPLTVELLPDPAANDLRLTQLAAERHSPLDRLNILHGSALQRLSTQRLLAEANDGGLAAVYGFTPVDLAQAVVQLGDAPERQAWPAGADRTTLKRILRARSLPRLDPDAPGVPAALLRTLTDLREAALTPEDLPDAPHSDLYIAFSNWREVVSACADRTSYYEDAIASATPDSAVREALGGAPLIVSGIYDLTRIQRLLLARLAAVADVRMLLVAPSDDPASLPRRTLGALRRELNVRVIHSSIAASARAPDQYFSVGDPTAETDEIASRILQLGRDGVAFHRIAILHQQGAPADDRICAALERADISAWRIGGRQLVHTPIGHAALTLTRLLLDPGSVERSALLDWLSHRSLRERPLGLARRPARWERIALDAGCTRGLREMRHRLEADSTDDADELAALVNDLCQRSRDLEAADSWDTAAAVLLQAIDDYCDDQPGAPELIAAVRDTLGQLPAHSALGARWSPEDGLTALNRAFRSRVVRNPQRLVGGVNVGAATGPARGIRYEAVFVAGVAEQLFPAVGRQDPLLTDDQRADINARIPDALALQRDRVSSDRHAWSLARLAARRQFTASWSRRSSAVGGPARPSSLILEAAAETAQGSSAPPSEASLIASGRIVRIDSSIVTATPSASAVAADDWSATLKAPDGHSFDLALLTAPDVDAAMLVPALWSESDAARHARRQRNEPTFTDYDGRLELGAASGSWRPLERIWTAASLETYLTCPYRFYLRYIIDVQADAESERPDQQQQRAQDRLIRRILSSWVREYERVKADRTWLEYVDNPDYMNMVARRILDSARDSSALAPPWHSALMRNDMMSDLDRARRHEVANARSGWRPLDVNVAFDDAPIKAPGKRTLRLRGVIDRIDAHASGRQRALSFFTGPELADVRGFVNGSSFVSVANLSGLRQRGVPIRRAEVEHRSVTSRGNFESETLAGETLSRFGDSSAPNDADRLRDTLGLIADQLESASFIPYPGHPSSKRPNCVRCPYESSCTPDIGRRYENKRSRQPDAVRSLEALRQQRI